MSLFTRTFVEVLTPPPAGGADTFVVLTGALAGDTVELVALGGYGPVPPWVSVQFVAGATSGQQWRLRVQPYSLNAYAERTWIFFLRVTRGGSVDFQRLVGRIGSGYENYPGIQYPEQPRPPYPSYRLFDFWGHYALTGLYAAATTFYVTAGQPFSFSAALGNLGVTQPNGTQLGAAVRSFAATNKLPWLALSLLEVPASNTTGTDGGNTMSLTGTAPTTLGLQFFDLALSNNGVGTDPAGELRDRTRVFFFVGAPSELWSAPTYTTSASPGAAFGWTLLDKVFPGSTVVITAGPSWLSVDGSLVSGTVPASAADTTVNVALRATLAGENGPVVRTATLSIYVTAAGVLWIDPPYHLSYTGAGPINWSGIERLVPGATMIFHPYAGNHPAWLAIAGNTLTGTNPANDTTNPNLYDLRLLAYRDNVAEATTLSLIRNKPGALWYVNQVRFRTWAGRFTTFSLDRQSAADATLSITSQPPGLGFTLSGRALVGTPAEPDGFNLSVRAARGGMQEDKGVYVEVQAADARWDEFEFFVPAYEGEPLSWDAAAHGLADHYTHADLPDWLTLAGGVLSGTPPVGLAGDYRSVTLVAVSADGYRTSSVEVTFFFLTGSQLWGGDPFMAQAVEGVPFSWNTLGKLSANTSVTAEGLPSWLTLNGNPASGYSITGTPPFTTKPQYTRNVTLTATRGDTVDVATFVLTVIPSNAVMFINAPYTAQTTEGAPFSFPLTLNGEAEVTATGLPSWLILQQNPLAVVGTVPLGAAGTVVVGLTADDGEDSVNTTLTITVAQLVQSGLNYNVLTGGVEFIGGGGAILKHGNQTSFLVNILPPEQAGNVSGIFLRLKEADALAAYGELLTCNVFSRLPGTATFQFAPATVGNPRLDHAMSLLDPVQVAADLDVTLEIGVFVSGQRRTSLPLPVKIVRDFDLRSAAGGSVSIGGGNQDGSGNGNGGAGFGPVFSFPLSLAGMLVEGRTFGAFRLPVAAQVEALVADLQDADATAGVTLKLCDEGGVPFGDAYGITLAAGAARGHVEFTGNTLALAAGTVVRAKVTGYVPADPTVDPAQFLTLHVVCRQ